MRISEEAWCGHGRHSEQSGIETVDPGRQKELCSSAVIATDASATAGQARENIDPGIGYLKICFATLSLWPPCGFVFAADERPQAREDQCLVAFVSSAIPLALGWLIAWLSMFSFCTQRILQKALFASDIILAAATWASGILVIVYYFDWEAACDGGAEDACSLRVVALRVIVDVFGMAAIHLSTALWMHFSEGVCKRDRVFE